MTINTTDSQKSFDGNGVSTTLPFDIPFFSKSDIVVTLYDADNNGEILTLNDDYTIPGVIWIAGGSVVLNTAAATGETVIVSRILDLVQEFGFRNLGDFRAEVHEDAFDKIIMMLQQIATSTSRALVFKEYVKSIPKVEQLNDSEFIIQLGNSIVSSGITTKQIIDMAAHLDGLQGSVDRLPDMFVNRGGDSMKAGLDVVDSTSSASAVPKASIARSIDSAINTAMGVLPDGTPRDYGFLNEPVTEVIDLGGLV